MNKKARPPRREAHPDWEWIGFRVDPKLKLQVRGLMKFGCFISYRDYFIFLVRQELRSARAEVLPPKG